MALRLEVKSLSLKTLFCPIPKVPLLEIHSLFKNFFLPDVFLQSSNFHESDVMNLSYDFHLLLANWSKYTQKFMKIKINLNIIFRIMPWIYQVLLSQA